MTMAINRSVDFTMVNSNVSLIPVYETRKFTEVLSEQIACIKTLQNTVHLKMGPMPPSMCSHTILDVIWVKESLLCLLSNSVRHSSGGTIHINTELVAGDDEDTVSRTSQKKDSLSDVNMYIKVTVVDDGVGISEKTRKNIFQPLRPSNSPTGKTCGHLIQ